MKARLRKFLSDLGDAFWLVPSVLVCGSTALAATLVQADRRGVIPTWLIDEGWIYGGGATGARALLGAVASSTIGVAGTVFSITIAALSLAANQMGPRLLRNFTRDRGNQATLGTLLGTFTYSLVVLRSVRTPAEGEFVPHFALTVGILLAFASVGTLVFFVGHMAGRINVDVVIDLVTADVRDAISRMAKEDKQASQPSDERWPGSEVVVDLRGGYLQHLDADGLADWAGKHDVAVRLLVRPGQFVFRGTPFALVSTRVEGTARALDEASALGPQRATSVDIEYAVRQLVEVAIRALSPGTNDPHTAINVLDRLGSLLCELVPLHLPTGVHAREGKIVLVVPSVDYDGLTDTMFHMIRQSAAGSPAVLISMLEVLTAVAKSEKNLERRACLRRHADLVMDHGRQSIAIASDLEDLGKRFAAFTHAVGHDVQAAATIEV